MPLHVLLCVRVSLPHGQLMQEGAVAAPAEMHAMAWDPHNANEVSVSADAHVNQWDVRTLK